MHNLKATFDKFIDLIKSLFSDRINEFDNFQSYPRNPKMSDCQIIALALTAESIGIDSESYFFGKLKSDYTSDFPNLIDRSNFNRRHKQLYIWVAALNQIMPIGKIYSDTFWGHQKPRKMHVGNKLYLAKPKISKN